MEVKGVILFIFIFVLIISMFNFLNSSPTEVRVTIVNKTSSTNNPADIITQTGETGNNNNAGSGECTSKWECTQWKECVNFVKTRECNDTSCGVIPIKMEKQLCIPKEGIKKIINSKNFWWRSVLVIIFLLLLLWIILKRRKNKKKRQR